MLKKAFSKLKPYCPLYAVLFYFLCIFAGAIHIISSINTAFADFFNLHISSVLRTIIAYITKYLPFSLAESIIVSLPLIAIVLFIHCVRLVKNGSTQQLVRFFNTLLSLIALLYAMFVLTFGVAYKTPTLDVKLKLNRREVSADELYSTASTLLEQTSELLDEIDFIYGSHSIMPYSLDEMNARINDAIDSVRVKYDFIPKLHSKIKYVALSEPWTYTHISGMYTYYTGEANLNINFPDYTLPFTTAHELSHQRGIARENEANFMAFLICIESDDPYIRYSGYMNMYEYVASALYSADPDRYFELLASMDNRMRYEMIAYNSFFDKYRQNIASTVSNAVNDSYLKLQGQTAGTRSYGLVVDLAVAYYLDN